MANEKVMSFDEFAGETALQDPKTALKGDNVDPHKKEPFVDQVKRADPTKLDVNQPDYSKVNEDAAAMQNELITLERELVALKQQVATKEQDLQTKREALVAAQQAEATQNKTTVPPSQNTPAPTAQQSIGSVTPGQTPAAPTTA